MKHRKYARPVASCPHQISNHRRRCSFLCVRVCLARGGVVQILHAAATLALEFLADKDRVAPRALMDTAVYLHEIILSLQGLQGIALQTAIAKVMGPVRVIDCFVKCGRGGINWTLLERSSPCVDEYLCYDHDTTMVMMMVVMM